MTSSNLLYCSFCAKSQNEVKKLVVGKGVFICDECIDLCASICFEEPGNVQDILPKTWQDFLAWYESVPRVDPTDSSLRVRPRFNSLKFTPRRNHIFYLCPFADPFHQVYSDHVKSAAVRSGFTIDRADEIYGTQPIIEDIWTAINCAAVIVADVTGRNPNVMYEVGIAHTVGKHVVILSQDANDIPFDLRHQRCIVYSFTPRGCAQLEEQIRGTLEFLTAAI